MLSDFGFQFLHFTTRTRSIIRLSSILLENTRLPDHVGSCGRTFSEIRQETAKGLIAANAEWLTGCVYI